MKTVLYDSVYHSFKLPVKMWLDDVEESAFNQIQNLSNLPFAFHHVAIMPDCHMGYGMPIGGVLATQGVVIPNAVGVDIGCGMCAVKTSLKASQLDTETLKKIMGRIREVVPVGFEHQKKEQDIGLMPCLQEHLEKFSIGYEHTSIINKEYSSALKQLGTLGGGNHFIEIQKDTEDNVWIMIHSGSRNLGKKVADHYNKIAVELNKRWFSCVPKEWELAFLPIETQEAKNYLAEMNYCIEFALANRKLMMDNILNCFCDILGVIKTSKWREPIINIAHNYARYEHHFGKDVLVHRKGATSAKLGEIGIIPGSQGTSSYIVKGKGNADSFMSCSHGAGRCMGRKQASRTLSLEGEIKRLDEQGIIHGIRTEKDLDEASGAYKNIDVVMENQKDLVEIVTKLQPLAVIKG